ncbi:MAG: glycosyltransferase [Alphaproteobacteria bacterium]|nr:glycosyltransferase [Alphaproteobacteria bacterium]
MFELLHPFHDRAETLLALGQAATALSLLAWLYLLFLHGRFWKADQRLPPWRADRPPPITDWPRVVAVVPARNEADVIGAAVGALLALDYPGGVPVVLVDDGSTDGTADAARAAAATLGAQAAARLVVLTGAARPPGWAGKVWAMAQGIAEAERLHPAATHLLLTDADIAHDPANLRELAVKAMGGGPDGRRHVLVSLMVMLKADGFWERLLIPAFVYFFQQLYPFPWVNDPARRIAAAAGGCMLVERRALAAAGGMAAIRDRIIDDCALAGRLKPQGPIWLGLTPLTVSLRGYGGLAGVWHMVARSAYTQLRHSPWLLAGTMVGMLLLYAAPPAAAVAGWWRQELLLQMLGIGSWLAMVWTMRPTLRLYGRPAPIGLALPLAGLLYALMTLSSAVAHWRGRGGAWKGRVAGRRDEHPA